MTKDELKTARADLGMSQSQIALAMGIPKYSYQNYEAGRRPVPGWVPKIIEFLQKEKGEGK